MHSKTSAALANFMEANFPPVSEFDELDDLHTRLVLLDGELGAIAIALTNDEYIPSSSSLIEPDLQLRKELLEIMEDNDVAYLDAKKYLSYLDKIDALISQLKTESLQI